VEPLIDVQHVSFAYPSAGSEEFLALNDINLQVKRGEFLAIVGANGSGKSTLAKHFNALLRPTEGRVVVDGMVTEAAENIWEIRQRVGMVFQNPDNQLVATTVEEDVAFGPENLGLPPDVIRERIGEALQVVDMEERRQQAPHNLSGGQKQRVAIAGILAMLPTCVVFDEPTAMLDPLGRKEVLEVVHQLNSERGMTVVWITHFMEEVLLADRVVVMSEGELAMRDSPARVFHETEKLRSLGLDVPQIADLVEALQQQGIELEPDITAVEELVDALCSLSSAM
jgi:energy-coupling factor transport system ATP-binding protein